MKCSGPRCGPAHLCMALLLAMSGLAGAQPALPCTLAAQGAAELQVRGSATSLPLSLGLLVVLLLPGMLLSVLLLSTFAAGG